MDEQAGLVGVLEHDPVEDGTFGFGWPDRDGSEVERAWFRVVCPVESDDGRGRAGAVGRSGESAYLDELVFGCDQPGCGLGGVVVGGAGDDQAALLVR